MTFMTKNVYSAVFKVPSVTLCNDVIDLCCGALVATPTVERHSQSDKPVLSRDASRDQSNMALCTARS